MTYLTTLNDVVVCQVAVRFRLSKGSKYLEQDSQINIITDVNSVLNRLDCLCDRLNMVLGAIDTLSQFNRLDLADCSLH